MIKTTGRKGEQMEQLNELLMKETEKGNVEEVEKLLEKGADVHYQDEKGRTPLMAATQQNNIPLAKRLIEAGSDVNQRDNMLLTPWICAAANGFYEILELGAAHADVKLANRFGGTALLPSSEKGFLKAVDVAIKAGVPINHINDLGWTALQEAVVLGDGGSLYSLILKLLMNHGADPTTLDHDGKTAIDWAKEYGQSDVVAILEGTYDKKDPEETAIVEILQFISDDDYEAALEKSQRKIEKFQSLTFYYLKGYIHTLQKDYEEGLAVYEEALSKEGGSPEFYFYIANALREQKRVEEAIAAYQKAIELDQNYFYFRYHLSNYLRELGRHEEAIQQMDTLLEQNPERYDYLFHKANSLRVLGKNEEADKLLAVAKEKNQ